MIYVVLGMHKSGTTMVSQILHSSGIHMGEFDAGLHYDQGNKYERAESLALDLDILGADTYDVLSLPPTAPDSLTELQRERMSSLIRVCDSEHDDWGMKDPRMCLTYHLWSGELPPHRLIVVYRDPAQVWPRFKWRGKRGVAINLGRAHTYQRMWVEHNRRIIKALRSRPAEGLILGYHELMTDQRELDRLRSFVDRDLVDLRKPELYRSRSEPDHLLRLSGWYLEKKAGLSTHRTFSELEEFRRRQVEDETTR